MSADDLSAGDGWAAFKEFCGKENRRKDARPRQPSRKQTKTESLGVTEGDTTHDALPPEFSEESLALRFAERHQNDLRYVAIWNRWLSWRGTHWQFDNTLHALNQARAICREASAACNNPNAAKALASAKTVAAVVTLARADRRIAATAEQWDRDPWLLNTPGGVVDLQTGAQRPASPDDYMTKITGAAPDTRCPIPHWRAFLDRVTGGDRALAAFLQRMAGYCLTGHTSEHALFFLYGTGANGKSTFVNAVIGCVGDYYRSAPIETFTEARGERHPTELAGLRGARLVTAVETEEGRQWAESKIKQLTGGDPISARFMRQDFFEFTPQFKLVIAGNHRPGLRTVDEAIRRRFYLFPFTVTIPKTERDKELPEKLKAERPGILAWMIDGCMSWQKDGLAPPDAVTAATNAYLEAEDTFAEWLEGVPRNPEAWTRSSALYADWKAWTERRGERAGSQKRFSQNLEARGFVLHRRNSGNGFVGLKLPEPEQSYPTR